MATSIKELAPKAIWHNFYLLTQVPRPSGHLQKVHDILTDCDEDVLIYLVSQEGCACHEGYRSCFFRDLAGNVILPRLKDPKDIYR
mgnify:CR=1 FL=1